MSMCEIGWWPTWRAWLLGPRFARALHRNASAARALDKAVREILET